MPSFEQGPIRPPNEAASLLLRFTRNCPWNKCAFCPVYKQDRFSRRSLEEILQDIDAVAEILRELREYARSLTGGEELNQQVLTRVLSEGRWSDQYRQVAFWLARGDGTVFIQDANSLIMKTEDLVQALQALRQKIPQVRRVTMYARSSTVARKSQEELTRIRQAGLDRLHIGLESGSDRVLKLVNKGTSAQNHIEAGQKAVQSGFTLSEYIMPGLGGRELSRDHALETARVLDEIDPHYIRLRTLTILPGTELDNMRQRGEFTPMDDEEIVAEIRLLIQSLEKTSAWLASDHIMNLLQDVEGQLSRDKEAMLQVIDDYLNRPYQDRLLYRLGRRGAGLSSLKQLDSPSVREKLERAKQDLESREGTSLEKILEGMGREHL